MICINDSQKTILIKDIITYFRWGLNKFKYGMNSKEECGHYQIKTRLVSLVEMIGIYNHYYRYVRGLLNEFCFSDDITRWWKKQYVLGIKIVLMQSIKYDISFLMPKWVLHGYYSIVHK